MSPKCCVVCGRVLNQSQWRRDKQYKSCPSCSTRNGNEHVYYSYPENFGTTPKRESSINPDGPQSYCIACRGGREGLDDEKVLCSEF